MRRLLHTLRRLGSSARRGRRPAPAGRPGLELLEGREVPTTLGITSTLPSYLYDLQTAPLTSTYTITQPSPTMLPGQSVTLTQPGNPSNMYGTIKNISLTQNADGSYAFTATYQTSLYSVKDMPVMGHPAVINITGTLGAPQYSNFFTATCSLYINCRAPVYFNGQMVYEHVQYQGTVTLTSSGATITGNLLDCLENSGGYPIFGCSSPPASGTFV